MIINLQAVPIDEQTYILECDECGVVGTETPEGVNDLAFTHLEGVHGVEVVTWRLDGPGTSQDPLGT